MRRMPRAVTLGLLLALLLPAGRSDAATTLIVELNFVFAPDPASIRLGDTITWENQVENMHTTTDQGQLQLWDSGLMDLGDTFSYTVTAAGTYPYFCRLHERYGMFGTLQVKVQASPPSGPVGTVFTITVATVAAPDGFVYDIQKRDAGGLFRKWISTTEVSATFDSTGQVPGRYRFRSRLRRLSDGGATAYSPAATVRVNG
jgi:plastocyanin